MTAWLGRWLCEHYELTDRRGSEAAAAWDQSLANVRRQQATALAEAPDLTSALMLLVGQDFAFTVQADAAALEPPAVQALCAALGMPAAGGEKRCAGKAKARRTFLPKGPASLCLTPTAARNWGARHGGKISVSVAFLPGRGYNWR